MNLSEKVALRLLSNLDPEKAHNLAMRALKIWPYTQNSRFSGKKSRA